MKCHMPSLSTNFTVCVRFPTAPHNSNTFVLLKVKKYRGGENASGTLGTMVFSKLDYYPCVSLLRNVIGHTLVVTESYQNKRYYLRVVRHWTVL